jgi:hypothetical protein
MAHRINEELRYFLDEQSRREGRRVAELVEHVRRLALTVREHPPSDRAFMTIEGNPDIDLVMERPLYAPQAQVHIAEAPSALGLPQADTAPLFEPDAVDLELLRSRVRALLRDRPQVSLTEITASYPIEKGIAELVGYFTIASRSGATSVDDDARTPIVVRNERSRSAYLVRAPALVFLPELAP